MNHFTVQGLNRSVTTMHLIHEILLIQIKDYALNLFNNFLIYQLLTVLPMFVNHDIRKEMERRSDSTADTQFKKLYIYHMDNVSILFADIKVRQQNHPPKIKSFNKKFTHKPPHSYTVFT